MSKKLIQLQSGSLETTVGEQTETRLDKKALLVYAGKFNSMDGEVDITDEHIDKLASNHNGFVANLKRLAGLEEVPAKSCPPIQLDHSTSAKDTVGRLIGNLEVGSHKLSDGTEVKALFGTVRILGKENVERVADGRWTNLSIGADLEDCKVSELTITPFPAAAEASLLSAKMSKISAKVKWFDKRDGEGIAVDEKGNEYYFNRSTIKQGDPRDGSKITMEPSEMGGVSVAKNVIVMSSGYEAPKYLARFADQSGDRKKYYDMIKAYTSGDSEKAKTLANELKDSKELDPSRMKDVKHVLESKMSSYLSKYSRYASPNFEQRLESILKRAGVTADVGISGRAVAIGVDTPKDANKVKEVFAKMPEYYKVTGTHSTSFGIVVDIEILEEATK